MTHRHIVARNRRIRARRGTDPIWYLIAGLVGAALILSAFGLMDWNPQVAVPTTAPIELHYMADQVQEGALRLGN